MATDGIPKYVDPETEPSQVLTPGSPVHMSLRVLLGGIVSLVALASLAGVGYASLASDDRNAAEKVKALEEKIHGMTTRADLRELRLQVRNDILSSTWDCEEVKGGRMRCTPRFVGSEP